MLCHRITFYVPSTKNVGNKLTRQEQKALTERVQNFMANTFGGFTSVKGIGGWKQIRERVTLVTSYHDKTTAEALAIVLPLAEAIKSEYGQEAITLETEQGCDFI